MDHIYRYIKSLFDFVCATQKHVIMMTSLILQGANLSFFRWLWRACWTLLLCNAMPSGLWPTSVVKSSQTIGIHKKTCTRFLPLAIKYSTLFLNLWRWKTKNFSWNPLITFSYIRPYVKHTELFTVINVTFRVTTQICISVLVAVFSSVLHCLPSTIFLRDWDL